MNIDEKNNEKINEKSKKSMKSPREPQTAPESARDLQRVLESPREPQRAPESPRELHRAQPNLGKAFGPTKSKMLPQAPRNIRIPKFRQRSLNLGKALAQPKSIKNQKLTLFENYKRAAKQVPRANATSTLALPHIERK